MYTNKNRKIKDTHLSLALAISWYIILVNLDLISYFFVLEFRLIILCLCLLFENKARSIVAVFVCILDYGINYKDDQHIKLIKSGL